MDQQNLYYNKHWTIPFRKCFQVNNENNPANSNVSRTIDGIYLQSLDTYTADIFDLHSHRAITRRKIIKIPIPRAIIKHFEKMAACEKST